jgi:2-C-methyl-D-erythritol 4-phosphate cytidylyltransferase/2-C-methyl-D-erythritol 2,4-cyclodiphosphate synthase
MGEQSAKVGAVIVAGGRGERFGADRPKQALEIAGRSVARWAVESLLASPRVDCAVVVVPADPAAAAQVGRALGAALDHAKLVAVVPGGARRQDSVLAGLRALPADVAIAAVHDAARPFPPLDGLARALDRVVSGEADGAILALPATDTLKAVDAERAIAGTLDRAATWAAQTPQVFRRDALTAALERAGDEIVTDEAQAVERFGGGRVVVVEGSPDNLKITFPADLPRAEAIAARRGGAPAPLTPSPSRASAPERSTSPASASNAGGADALAGLSIGFGYDVHRLVPGRPLILGGVRLEHPDGLGLEGHSDADVLAHAICDALLGAAGLGDIGQHFPPGDPRWKGADSMELLRLVGALLAAEGWRVLNVDATLVAERPKILAHVPAMRERMSAALRGAGRGGGAGRVSVKATTNEKLGFEGREEGMAAFAVALLVRN